VAMQGNQDPLMTKLGPLAIEQSAAARSSTDAVGTSSATLSADPQPAKHGARSRRKSREAREARAEPGEIQRRCPAEAEGRVAASGNKGRRIREQTEEGKDAASAREDSAQRKKAKSVLVVQKDELLQSSLVGAGSYEEERPISRNSRSASPLSQVRQLTQSKTVDRDGPNPNLQADTACAKCRNVFLKDEIFCRKCGQRRESIEATHLEPLPSALLSRPSSRGNSRPPSSGGQTSGRPPMPARPDLQASRPSSRLQVLRRPCTPPTPTASDHAGPDR